MQSKLYNSCYKYFFFKLFVSESHVLYKKNGISKITCQDSIMTLLLSLIPVNITQSMYYLHTNSSGHFMNYNYFYEIFFLYNYYIRQPSLFSK